MDDWSLDWKRSSDSGRGVDLAAKECVRVVETHT
jgi:hypothetical protein